MRSASSGLGAKRLFKSAQPTRSERTAEIAYTDINHHTSNEVALRTTLDIDDDVLTAAKDIARLRQISIGKAVSECARQALALGAVTKTTGFASEDGLHRKLRALGVVPFKGGKPVTDEMIDMLRNQESI